MKNLFVYFISLFAWVAAYAQQTPSFQSAIEIEVSKKGTLNIQPVGSEGLVLIKKDTEIKKTLDIRWTIVHLDKNFHKQSEVSSGITSYLKLTNVYYDTLTNRPKLYLFFAKQINLKKSFSFTTFVHIRLKRKYSKYLKNILFMISQVNLKFMITQSM